MNTKQILTSLIAVGAVCATTLMPMQADAQSNRQKQKNQWRNISIGAGAVGLYGLLKGDSTLALVGTAGALYSADRYEKDRKSQSKNDRARAELFRRGSYTSHGHRYVKKTVRRNGHTYYQFVRQH